MKKFIVASTALALAFGMGAVATADQASADASVSSSCASANGGPGLGGGNTGNAGDVSTFVKKADGGPKGLKETGPNRDKGTNRG